MPIICRYIPVHMCHDIMLENTLSFDIHPCMHVNGINTIAGYFFIIFNPISVIPRIVKFYLKNQSEDNRVIYSFTMDDIKV